MKIKQGVTQGCILSTSLSNMYSEEVMNSVLEKEKGIVINGKKLTVIRYAWGGQLISTRATLEV